MKHNIFLLLSSLAILGCKSGADYTINGQIEGAKNGTLFLQREVNGILKNIDSVAMSKDGKFSFSGDIESPEVFYLTFGGNNLPLSFFIEKGSIDIKAKVDSLPNATVIGGPNQELYTKFTDSMKEIAKRQEETYVKALEFSLEGANKDSLAHYTQRYNSSLKLQGQFIANFAITNSEHEIAPMVAYTFLTDGYAPILDSIVKVMSPEVATSKYGRDLTELVNSAKNSLNGMTAPEFKLSKDGKDYTPASFKGKTLMLVVWSADDEYNTNFLKALKNAYSKWNEKGLEILSTCASENTGAYKYDTYTLELPWVDVHDGRGFKNEIVQKFAISGGLPATILIAADGTIIGRNISAETFDQVMEIMTQK